MEDIVIPLEGGRTARFPAGTSPEVISAALAKAGVAQVAAPASAAGAPASAAAAGKKPGALADSFLGRAARGAIINRIDPLAEMAARAMGSDEDVAEVQRMNAERQGLQDASRQRAGSTGMDMAGLAGTAVADAVTLPKALAAAGFPRLANPRSLMDVTKSGAVMGGIAGAASPVEAPEELGGPDYAIEKAKQGALGAGLGGVLAPAATLGIGKLTELAQGAGSAAKRFLQNRAGATTAARTVNDTRMLETFLRQQAQTAGVDWTRMPGAVQDSLREATRRAVSTTGELPATAVRNRMLAEAENLPQLTLGQATRDPMQFSREANSPETDLRNYFGGQRTAATEKLKSQAQALGPERSRFDVGTEIGTEVSKQAAARRKEVGELFDSFRNDAGGYHKISNTPDFVRNTMAELKTTQVYDDLPPVFQRQLAELEAEGKNLSIRDVAQMWKNINSYYDATYGTPAGNALGVVKTELSKLLDDPKFAASERGPEVIEKFRAANARRREMGQWEKSSAAIADMASKNPRVAAEKVFERYVMSGSVKDFKGLWETLPEELRPLLKRQFVDAVTEKALNRYGTEATSASSAVKLLKDFPPEKLKLMFPGEELKSLKNTLEYLRLTSEAPPGSFVNRSNSLVDLKDFLSQSRNIPLLGPAVSRPLQGILDQQDVRTALDPALAAVPLGPAPVPRSIESIMRRTPQTVGTQGPSIMRGVATLGEEEDGQ
jgi:hypothetical protein